MSGETLPRRSRHRRRPGPHYKQVPGNRSTAGSRSSISREQLGSLSPEHVYAVQQVVDVVVARSPGSAAAVMMPVGLMVRLTSTGPALFKQKRIGFRGQPFTVYKFRTMRHDGAGGDRSDRERDHHDNDARILRSRVPAAALGSTSCRKSETSSAAR